MKDENNEIIESLMVLIIAILSKVQKELDFKKLEIKDKNELIKKIKCKIYTKPTILVL